MRTVCLAIALVLGCSGCYRWEPLGTLPSSGVGRFGRARRTDDPGLSLRDVRVDATTVSGVDEHGQRVVLDRRVAPNIDVRRARVGGFVTVSVGVSLGVLTTLVVAAGFLAVAAASVAGG